MGRYRDDASWAKSIEDLRSLTDEEIIHQHDSLVGAHDRSSPGRGVNPDYYLDELNRRAIERQGAQMLWLTWVILALTVINVAAVIVSVF